MKKIIKVLYIISVNIDFILFNLAKMFLWF